MQLNIWTLVAIAAALVTSAYVVFGSGACLT